MTANKVAQLACDQQIHCNIYCNIFNS